MNNYIGFIINLIMFLINIATCLISFIILIVIIHRFCYNRIEQKDRVIISLCVNIYPLVMVYTALAISYNTQTLLGDLYDWNFDSPGCVLIAYFSTSILSTVYWAFVNQAFFRLCRIVYSTHRWLQVYWLYILLSPIELILICILISPVLFWHDIIYLSSEYFCFVPITNIRGLVWLLVSAYGIPVSLVTLIYFRIILYLRLHANNQTLIMKQRQERDLIAMQRILIIIGLLMVLGIPAMIFLLIILVTHKEDPLFTRIESFFVSLSMMGLSLSIVFITPQFKSIILKRNQHNRVIPLHSHLPRSIPIEQKITTV